MGNTSACCCSHVGSRWPRAPGRQEPDGTDARVTNKDAARSIALGSKPAPSAGPPAPHLDRNYGGIGVNAIPTHARPHGMEHRQHGSSGSGPGGRAHVPGSWPTAPAAAPARSKSCDPEQKPIIFFNKLNYKMYIFCTTVFF